MDRPAVNRRNNFPLEPLEVIDPVLWQGAPVPERRWLWPDWIPLHAVTILGGEGGIGKSLLSLYLAASCATGRQFLGKSVMKCKVLLISCEDPSHELQRRLTTVNKVLDVDFADLENLKLVPRTGLNNAMMKFSGDNSGEPEPFFGQVRDTALEMGAQLIVLDNLADVFDGNENIRPQVRQFINGLTRLALDIDGAVVLLAHPSQAGRTNNTGESGSTAWNNSVRSRLYFSLPKSNEKDAEPEDPDARILSRQKSNYSRAGAYVAMRLKDGAFVVTGGSEEGEGASGPERRRKADAAFLKGLRDLTQKGVVCTAHSNLGSYAPKEILAKSKHGEGFSEEELKRAMDRLFKDDRITQLKGGKSSGLAEVEPESLDGF